MYRFFADVVRDEEPWMPTLGLSSVLLFANLLVLFKCIEIYFHVNYNLSTFEVVLSVSALSLINYFINFKYLSFNSYDFDFDLKAFITLILYIVLTIALIIILS